MIQRLAASMVNVFAHSVSTDLPAIVLLGFALAAAVFIDSASVR